jgi:hypothetical protein
VAGDLRGSGSLPVGKRLVIGVSIGLALAGAGSLARHVAPSTSPLWGNLAPVSAFIPFVVSALGPVNAFFTQAAILLTVLYGIHRRGRGSGIWIFLGIALAGSSSIETIPSWLIIGFTTGIVLMLAYLLVFRHYPELLLITTGTLVILSAIRDGVQRTYPLALPASLAGALCVAVTAWICFRGTMDKTRAGF